MKFRVIYNAPFSLTFGLLCAVVFLIDSTIYENFTDKFFTIPNRQAFRWGDFSQWGLLFSYVFGHANWTHLSNNMAYILLLGPVLEDRFGSWRLLVISLFTALLAALVNVLFSNRGLLGASGIVFMMITLISMVRIRKQGIPLTLIVIFFLYLSQEILSLFNKDQISQTTHIIGGLCGIFFGFMFTRKESTKGQNCEDTHSSA